MKKVKDMIDLILTSKPLHFQKTHVVEKGLSEYPKLILIFFDKRAPLKNKFVRGNNAPFMTREFQKEIYVTSTLKEHSQV